MFTTELELVEIDNRPNFWRLDAPLSWVDPSVADVNMQHIIVPPDFITDLASIPAALRGLLDVNGRSRRPAALHDWLYAAQICSRAVADETLRRALIAEGESSATARVYWLGVRLGGGSAWDGHKQTGLASCFYTPDSYRSWLKAA